MPKDYSRTRRVGEQLQRETAQLIQQEIKDPRIGLVTISGVKLSRDMSHATIYFTVLDEAHPVEETLKVLEGAAGFLRRELAKRMSLRIMPHLHFKYDESITYGNELSALINKAINMENPDNRMADAADTDKGEEQD